MLNCMMHPEPNHGLTNDDKNKINLIAGATTAPLLDTIWEMSEHDEEVLNQFIVLLTTLYKQEQYKAMFDVIRLTHGLIGLKMPEPVEELATHPKALQFYLGEFLMDVDDIILDYNI